MLIISMLRSRNRSLSRKEPKLLGAAGAVTKFQLRLRVRQALHTTTVITLKRDNKKKNTPMKLVTNKIFFYTNLI